MDVIIIDATHQRFNGVTYRKNKRGWYQTAYTALHRDVWEYHFGKIPKGYDIHHRDENKANNDISNLQMLTRKEHRQLHSRLNAGKPKTPKTFVCQQCGATFQSTANVAKYCPDCHKEREREKSHASYAAKRAAKRVVKPFKPRRFRTCVVCGKPFELKYISAKGRKTCSKECHDKLAGKLPVKICKVCGKEFKPRHSWNVCCSPECGYVLTAQAVKERAQALKGKEFVERVISHCEWCGKEIRHLPSQHPRFCSQDCLHKFMAKSFTKHGMGGKEIRTCAHCGKSFECCKTARKTWCSPECRRSLNLTYKKI